MKTSLLSTFLALGFVFLTPCLAQDAKGKTYQINMDRPAKKGDKLEVQIKGKTKMSKEILITGQPKNEESETLTGELKGTIEILATSEKGGVMKCKIIVELFKLQNGEEDPRTLMEGGKELIAEAKDGKAVFTVNGEEVDEESAKMLDILVELRKNESDDLDENKAFGMNKPYAVGDEWAVNTKELFASMPKNMPFVLTEKDMAGTVTLKEIKKIDGVEAGLIQVKVKLNPSGLKGMPPQMKITKSDMVSNTEVWMPTDAKKQIIFDKEELKFDFIGTGDAPDGKRTLKLQSEQSRERKLKSL